MQSERFTHDDFSPEQPYFFSEAVFNIIYLSFEIKNVTSNLPLNPTSASEVALTVGEINPLEESKLSLQGRYGIHHHG